MGILARAFEVRSQLSSPQDWLLRFFGGGQRSATGLVVSPESAMGISAVFACVRILAGTIAKLPLITYARTADGGRSRATDYFLYELLHDAPNEEQTSFELRDMLQGHLCLRGNAYLGIDRVGTRPTRLVPLHPDRVRPRRLASGELVYDWLPLEGLGRVLSPRRGEIMHLRSLSDDGIAGRSVVSYARESFGLAIAAEEFGARLYSNGAQLNGALKIPGRISDKARKNIRESLEERHVGLQNAFRPLILEEGLDWVNIGMKADDAQFLESRRFQIAEVARWFLIPPHMIGDTDRSTSWGTGIEQQTIGFVVHTMGYWFALWEAAIRRDLIPPGDRKKYFVEFLVDGLLRGDQKARYEAYRIGREGGWLSVNQILRLENMDPIGPEGDTRLQPLNFAPLGSQTQPAAAEGA